jgi:hypothetical protein
MKIKVSLDPEPKIFSLIYGIRSRKNSQHQNWEGDETISSIAPSDSDDCAESNCRVVSGERTEWKGEISEWKRWPGNDRSSHFCRVDLGSINY